LYINFAENYENRFAGNLGVITKTPNFPAALFTVLYPTSAKKSQHNLTLEPSVYYDIRYYIH
jgi:hypothetical protein